MKSTGVRSNGLRSILLIAAAALTQPAPAQQVTLVNMIPNSLSGETSRDAEPNLSVNPANPKQIVGSAFTPDPLGTSNLPLFVSTDGGLTWSLTPIVPGTSGSCVTVICDITIRFAGSNLLYVSDLNPVGGISRLDIWQIANPTGAAVATALQSRNGVSAGSFVDQPYLQAGTASGTDRVLVADNDLTASGGKTATMDHSANAIPPVPSGFSNTVLETRTTAGQDSPSVRPAVHPNGTVYVIYAAFRSGGTEVVVARDDNWGTGGTPFRALIDGDGQPGIRVVSGLNAPGSVGSQRVGPSPAIAVDPNDSQTVYIVYGEGSSSANFTLHVRRSTNGGSAWSGDLFTVKPAINPGIAVTTTGQVGFLFQKFNSSRWETHLIRTTDNFTTTSDILLANVPDNAGSYGGSNTLGDYLSLQALGRDFYGIFSANNTADPANFYPGVIFQRNHDFASKTLKDLANNPVAVSIDPFFLHVMDSAQIQAPTSITFPVTCAGATAQATLTICNLGTADLHVSGIASSNPQFAVLAPSGGYPVTIAPGVCFPFQATFSPTGTGPQSATLTVSSDDPVNPTVTIAASGTAGAPAIATLIANTGDFGEVCPASFRDLPLTINNNGLCSLVVTGISSSSPDFKTATVVSFPLTVAPGTSLQVPIRFEPSSPGAKAGNLTVHSNDPLEPSAVVPVHGTGGQPVITTVVADTGDFGSVCLRRFKDLMVTVANSGHCPLKVTNIASSSPEFKVAQVLSYPLTVAPGGSIQVPIRYEPASPGAKTAAITVTSDDPVSPAKVVNVKATTPPEYICHPPTFAVVGADIGPAFGPARAGDFSFSGYGRFLAPFGVRKTYGVQVQGEYMYEERRQEGQFDGGLLSRLGPFQVGAFGSFKHVQFNGFQSGTSLGQAAFTADFLFLHLARFGAFGTLEFRDGNIVSTPALTPFRVRVMDQLGASGQVQLPLHNYLEGNVEWLHRSSLDRPGATLRFIHQWHNIGFFVEGNYNETFVDQHGSGRVVFGAQFGHWPRPRDLEDKRNPLGTDVPRIHYRVVP